MEKKNIILTGFMGTGKTTVGVLLAERLGYDFVDTDKLIEEKSGLSIPAFFKEKGDIAFRAMERTVAKELKRLSTTVISTGGRFMLDPVNADTIGNSVRIFCLVATPDEILKRVTSDPHTKRPLLEGENPRERIVKLLQQRQEGYAQFTQVVTTGKTPLQIVQDLMPLL